HQSFAASGFDSRLGLRGSEWACHVFSDSEEGIISGLFGFKVGWGLVVKTGVESGAVVEGFDVMEDGATRLGQGGEAVVVNQFVFETAWPNRQSGGRTDQGPQPDTAS